MKKIVKMSVVAAMMMGVGSVSAQADGIDIVSNVKVNGEIRPRYEMVDQDNALTNANALTNRLVIGASGDLLGTDWLSAYAEMTNVSALNDNYNSTNNGQTTYSTVADPEQTRLTQAYLDFKMAKTKLRAGRQMINLDNQRFVGAVGWRQMPQTFDAVTLSDNTLENLDLSATYITQINRVFDGSTAAGSYDTRTVLLNGSYKVMPELKVTAYGYLIGTTHDTYGVALSGDVAVSDGFKLKYRAEYATQTDPSMENSGTNANNVKVDADYYNIQVGMDLSGIIACARYEVLSGDNDGAGDEKAFSTPLATLHGQNGWADMFLGTPTSGLEDASLMVGYKTKDFGTAQVVYHDFSSDVGNTDFGTEIDAVYTRAIPGVNSLVGTVKVADFNADTASTYVDTTKFWLMLDYKFASK